VLRINTSASLSGQGKRDNYKSIIISNITEEMRVEVISKQRVTAKEEIHSDKNNITFHFRRNNPERFICIKLICIYYFSSEVM